MTTMIETLPMTDEIAVQAAVNAVKESLRKSKTGPPIHDISSELITDSNGFGAAAITIVLDDDPSGDPYPWDQLQPIYDLIWKVFNDRTLNRWPYIRFHLKSETEEKDDDANY